MEIQRNVLGSDSCTSHARTLSLSLVSSPLIILISYVLYCVLIVSHLSIFYHIFCSPSPSPR